MLKYMRIFCVSFCIRHFHSLFSLFLIINHIKLMTQRLSPVTPNLRVLIHVSRSRVLKTRRCILHSRSIIVLWRCFITIHGSPCVYSYLIWVFCHRSYNLYLFSFRLDLAFICWISSVNSHMFQLCSLDSVVPFLLNFAICLKCSIVFWILCDHIRF